MSNVSQIPYVWAATPKGSKTADAASWDDDSGALDLGASHSFERIRVAAVEDTWIVLNNASATFSGTEGEFVPAGSALMFNCAGLRYVHYKTVSVSGKISFGAYYTT